MMIFQSVQLLMPFLLKHTMVPGKKHFAPPNQTLKNQETFIYELRIVLQCHLYSFVLN